MKRFTDTNKWSKPFIRGLQGAYKLLWLYICDDCDNAGIWQVDFEIAQIRIGEKITKDTAINVFGDKIRQISNGQKWFIPSFIEFQYPSGLNHQNKAHTGVINALLKFDLIDAELKVKPLTSPLQGDKDKDKGMDKVMGMDKDKGESGKKIKPEIDQIENPFSENFISSIWVKWLKYRKEIKKPVNSISQQNVSLKHIYKNTNGNEVRAIDIIEKSIANGWIGFVYDEQQRQAPQQSKQSLKNQALDDLANEKNI